MLPKWVFQTWPSLRDRMRPQNIALASGELAYSLEDLQQPDVLNELLEAFTFHYPERKKAAIVSQWSMNYLSVCVPALLLPVVSTRCGVAIDGRALFLVTLEGAPQSLWLPSQCFIIPNSSHSKYYQALLDHHFAGLFSSLAQVGRVSERMLWSNFAIIWDNLFHRLSFHPELAAVAEDAQRWLYQAQISNSSLRLNHFMRLVASPVPEIRQKLPLRSHCCLHYMLHDRAREEVLCESCPRFHCWPLEQKIKYLNEIYED